MSNALLIFFPPFLLEVHLTSLRGSSHLWVFGRNRSLCQGRAPDIAEGLCPVPVEDLSWAGSFQRLLSRVDLL